MRFCFASLLLLLACAEPRLVSVPAGVTLSPGQLEFGKVELGAAKTLPLEITNTSGQTLSLAVEARAPFALGASLTLEGAGSRTLEVTFTPGEPGDATGVLEVGYEGGRASATLHGEGTLATGPTCVEGASCSSACLTAATCQGGVCRGLPTSCDDGDVCTVDGCDPAVGCVHPPRSCAAANACQASRCESGVGCVADPLPDGAECGRRSCTRASVCIAGECVERPTPGVTACAETLSADMRTCSLGQGGAMSCWGWALPEPDGGFTTALTARPQTGLPGPVTAISVGSAHTCAIALGDVYCWGFRDRGLLGVPGTGLQPLPGKVPNLPAGATSISAAEDHTCAVAGGGAYCWGDNTFGVLGDLSVASSHHPNFIGGNAGLWAWPLKEVTGGHGFACARDGRNELWCWGKNAWGTLGDGTQVASPRPVKVALPETAVQVSSGWSHSCAVGLSGQLYCWGYGWKGKLGDGQAGTTHFASVPVQPLGLPAVRAVSVSNFNTCAADSAGLAWCWGRNSEGPVGNGTQIDRLVPVRVPGLSGVTAVAVGVWHSCASHLGGVSCWGDNDYGELGIGVLGGEVLSPAQVLGL